MTTARRTRGEPTEIPREVIFKPSRGNSAETGIATLLYTNTRHAQEEAARSSFELFSVIACKLSCLPSFGVVTWFVCPIPAVIVPKEEVASVHCFALRRFECHLLLFFSVVFLLLHYDFLLRQKGPSKTCSCACSCCEDHCDLDCR